MQSLIEIVLEVLSKLPPKITLDHYWDIFDMLGWRFSSVFKNKRFTLQELKEALLSDELITSAYRSVEVAEEFINMLVSCGLLIYDGKVFHKSDRFDLVYYMIKRKIKESLRKLIAWSVWYLYSNGRPSFHVEELLEILAYPQREYLEYEYIEKTLKKLGLKYDGAMWHVSDSAAQRIKRELASAIEFFWPILGVRFVKGAAIKIERNFRNIYADMPNVLFDDFMHELFVLLEEFKDDPEVLYMEALKKKDEFNKKLGETIRKLAGIHSGWCKIIIRKKSFGEKFFGVNLKIDWGPFLEFLVNFARAENVPLEAKYRYLSLCRSEITWMKSQPSEEHLEKRVKELVRPYIGRMNTALGSFIDELNTFRKIVREKLLLRRKIRPLLLAYIPEMILTLRIIHDCIKKGAISTCYREMRKIIESISWVIADDVLLFRKGMRRYGDIVLITPLRIPSKEWYELSRRKRLIIKSIGDGLLKTPLFKKITECIKQEYKCSTRAIHKALFLNLTYPLFLLLVGKPVQHINKEETVIPHYEVKYILPLASRDLEDMLTEIKGSPLSEKDQHFKDELVRLIEEETAPMILIPYPSTSFIIQLISKMSGANLIGLYESYSFFVHSYDEAWQFYPFSSVLEFGILEHELQKFIGSIRQLLDFYDREVIKRPLLYDRSSRKRVLVK